MTKQEVVFCGSVFEKISDLFLKQEIWDANIYYKNLSYIKIKTLTSNKILLEKLIKASPGFLKVFKQHLFTSNFELVKDNSDKIFVKNSGFNSLCGISKTTFDNIIHTEKVYYKNELSKTTFNNIFELINIEGFIEPPFDSRLISSRRNIEIKKGNKFKFTKIFAPYFRNTLNLIIYDKYIRKRNRGFMNVIRILDLCENLIKCIVYTNSNINNRINKFDIEFDELEQELKKKYGEEKIEIHSTKQHRRKIITDDFELKIDPGLDFVNEDFICKENDVDLQISPLKKEYI